MEYSQNLRPEELNVAELEEITCKMEELTEEYLIKIPIDTLVKYLSN